MHYAHPRSLFFLCFMLVFSASFVTPTNAQEYHTFDFTAFSLKPGNYDSVYFFNTDGDAQQIQFESRRRSSSYSTKVDTATYTLSFYSEIPTDPEIPLPPPIGSVQIDPKWKESLMIFRDDNGRRKKSDPEEKASFTVVGADDSRRSFGKGSVKLVNFTSAPIIGTVNNEKFAFTGLTTSKPFDIEENDSAVVILATKGETRYRMIYKNEISVSKNSRSLLILRPPNRRGSIKIGSQLLVD